MQSEDPNATALGERVSGRTAGEERILEAVEFLTERLYDPDLAPSAVARHVGLGPWQFCRKFKSVMGMTCGEFIARRRMHEARRLLDGNDLLIKEIAYRVGFEDANYFSRCFKRIVGTSPTSYRRAGPAAGAGN